MYLVGEYITTATQCRENEEYYDLKLYNILD
jgi:hypothetical protein